MNQIIITTIIREAVIKTYQLNGHDKDGNDRYYYRTKVLIDNPFGITPYEISRGMFTYLNRAEIAHIRNCQCNSNNRYI